MRYRGPKAKVMRRFGVALAPSPKDERILEKRPHPPGRHGGRLHRYVAEALRRKGPTSTNLLQLLETRLDAVIFRLGFAPSIWATRQLVGHGHVHVNAKRVDIPSYRVRRGGTIAITDRMKRSRQMAVWAERGGILPPPCLELDRDTMTGRLARLPARDEIPIPVDDRLIVEFYSR